MQEAYAHWSVISVQFPPAAISKTRYYQVPLRARQKSRNKTLCHFQGEEAPIFCSCLYWLPFFSLAENHQDQEPRSSAEPTIEYKSTAVLPCVKGLSEQLHRCLQLQGIRTVFKSETTLRSHLVRPKDAVEPTKQDGMVYRIPSECGKVYIGETGRPMQDWESKNMSETSDLPLPRPPPFQNTQTTPDTAHFGTK